MADQPRHGVRRISTEAIATLIATLEATKNGLQWYRDNQPEADSQADDEMHAQLDNCLTLLASAADGDRYSLPPVVLTGYQLQQALGFVAPDATAEQLEQQVCIAARNQVRDDDEGTTLPAGLFVWLEEYPDEGLMPLDGEPSIGTAALLASTTTPADIAAEGLTACGCRWRGEDQVQRCSLHQAHVDTIHEWAQRARSAEGHAAGLRLGRDQLLEAQRRALLKLPRYSFLLLNGGVTRVHDPAGRWIEPDEAVAIVEPERADVMQRDITPGIVAHTGTAAAVDVLRERVRQVEREGWNAQHDDEHDPGELAAAAAAYAIAAADVLNPMSQGDGGYGPGNPPPAWPWSPEWWKPTTPRRNLEKSGALTLAAIEQIDRAGGTAR